MKCHNERMAKIRRHAQKKKEKERERAGGSKSRERGAGEFGVSYRVSWFLLDYSLRFIRRFRHGWKSHSPRIRRREHNHLWRICITTVRWIAAGKPQVLR